MTDDTPNGGSPVGITFSKCPARAAAALALVAALGLSACTSDNASTEPAAATRGNAIVALIQEPGIFSPLSTTQSGADLAYAFTLEPLNLAKPDGIFEPLLASEIPTIENGGVSEDGSVIRYTIKDGITWSDGEAFTAEDLEFAHEAIQNPDGEIVNSTLYESVESWQLVDDLSLEVTMTQRVPKFAMARHLCDEIAVLYLGRIVEKGPTDIVVSQLRHPHTRALLSAVPALPGSVREHDRRIVFQGEVPSASNPASGCLFRTRCPFATDRCAEEVPTLCDVDGRTVRCHFAEAIERENHP